MSGDVEPWSIRGGLAGEFLVRFFFFIFNQFELISIVEESSSIGKLSIND